MDAFAPVRKIRARCIQAFQCLHNPFFWLSIAVQGVLKFFLHLPFPWDCGGFPLLVRLGFFRQEERCIRSNALNFVVED